jgi:hypothetical protein
MAYKHGYNKRDNPARVYVIWKNMKARCNNPNDPSYKYYGARGIKVCDEWLGEKGAENFIKWALANGYRDDLTLDRIDNDKCYCPENCRFATIKAQENNRRDNRYLSYNGKTQTLAQWADELNIKRSTLWMRLSKYHWSVEKSLTHKASKAVEL